MMVEQLGKALKRVVYIDGVTKRYKVLVEFIAAETFAAEEAAEAWVSEHFDGRHPGE